MLDFLDIVLSPRIIEFIVLQYPKYVGLVLAPLWRDLSWQNIFSIGSLLIRLGITEEPLYLVSLFMQKCLNPKIMDDISCLVWLDIRHFSLFDFCLSWSTEFSHRLKNSSTSSFTCSLPSNASVNGRESRKVLINLLVLDNSSMELSKCVPLSPKLFLYGGACLNRALLLLNCFSF